MNQESKREYSDPRGWDTMTFGIIAWVFAGFGFDALFAVVDSFSTVGDGLSLLLGYWGWWQLLYAVPLDCYFLTRRWMEAVKGVAIMTAILFSLTSICQEMMRYIASGHF